MKSALLKTTLALLGVAVFVAAGITLENQAGVPFTTTYRAACVGICVAFFAQITRDYPGQRWPWISLAMALLIDIGMFLTPIFDRPASRGEILMFALPNATIFLFARALSYPIDDVHQRAVRQQLIVGAILAAAFSALVLAIGFVPDPSRR